MEILFEDCRETMMHWRWPSIDLVVTSPPYFVEKDYEIGMEWQDYLKLLAEVYDHFANLLKPGGYACINFGDQARGKAIDRSETHTTIPMQVYHYQFGMMAGLELTGTRVWRKKFSRMGIPFVCNHYPRHIFDYEYLWTWRKKDGAGKEVVRDRKLSQRGVLEFEGDRPLGRHVAAFPLALPEWCISVYSEPGDLVYDPFLGSGTTALAGRNLGRQFIGSEIDPAMKPVIEELLGGNLP